MPDIKLLREPGYIFDLLYVFFLKYNKQFCLENTVVNSEHVESEEFVNKILDEFSPMSDDLFVFFHALENGQCFITKNYFTQYREQFVSAYGIDYLQNELSDYESLTKRLIGFYFFGISDEEIDKCLARQTFLFDRIKKSEYSDTEKKNLYEFFANPDYYIQTLQRELTLAEIKLSGYYEKNYKKVFDIYNGLTFKMLSEQVKERKDISFIQKTIDQQMYVSFCLINKNCMNFLMIEEGALYLLGCDYYSTIEFLKNRNSDVKLSDFGVVIGEENRVGILDFMLKHGEITCKDLEKSFIFAGSTAYHHLTTMMKNGVVKTRNKGKTIYYSINTRYFKIIVNELMKYTDEKGGKRK